MDTATMFSAFEDAHVIPSDKTAFREAMIQRLDAFGITTAELARRSGVSKGLLDKLRQRRADVTNVHDAMKIAAAFGMTIEEFLGLQRRSDRHSELMKLFLSLPDPVRDVVLIQIRALVSSRTAASEDQTPKSADPPQA